MNDVPHTQLLLPRLIPYSPFQSDCAGDLAKYLTLTTLITTSSNYPSDFYYVSILGETAQMRYAFLQSPCVSIMARLFAWIVICMGALYLLFVAPPSRRMCVGYLGEYHRPPQCKKHKIAPFSGNRSALPPLKYASGSVKYLTSRRHGLETSVDTLAFQKKKKKKLDYPGRSSELICMTHNEMRNTCKQVSPDIIAIYWPAQSFDGCRQWGFNL